MKVDYELSRLAQLDLEEIWLFSIENWSLNQANKYYELIVNEITLICQNPSRGRAIPSIKPSHKIRQIKSHIIVYKIEQDRIWVDRILHKRMNIEDRLSEQTTS